MAKQKWYEGGLRFQCTQCGNCCSGAPGYVWVTKEEVRRISEFLGRTDGKLDRSQLRRVGLRQSLTEEKNGDCVFLRRENGKAMCSIYPVRPLQCRTWPFWSINVASPGDWEAAGEKCPGMNNGPHYGFVRIEELRLQKSW